MANELQKANKQSQISRPLSAEDQIKLALTTMAIQRDTVPSTEYLKAMASPLSKENLSHVLGAIETLGKTERHDGETALPSLGMILRIVRGLSYPFLDRVLRRLAAASGTEITADLQDLWWFCFEQRTEEDLDVGLKRIVFSESLAKMPTPGQFLAMMPTLRKRREVQK